MAKTKFVHKKTQSKETQESERKFGLMKQERWDSSLHFL